MNQLAEFKRKLRQLDRDGLERLFKRMQAEEAPLGLLGLVSREYTHRKRGEQ